MSWGTCYAGSNNIHFDYPPIMDDGRNYADWQPSATYNNTLRAEAGITTNAQYRKYLTDNADKIIKMNQIDACNQCCYCPARYGDNQPLKNSPFLYTSCVEKSQPYGYEDSDLKNVYLSSYQLQARMIAPILTQNQYLQERANQ